ncbi:MAG: polysaccharide deacetylase family protein [Elusimicrobiota bacterium]
MLDSAKKYFILPVLFLSISFDAGYARTVVLTFDDGPRPETTKKIISVLEDKKVPATFFLVGKMMEKHPQLVEKIYKKGFEIGNHTYTHPRLINLEKDDILKELNKFNSLLYDIVGKKTSFFRPPGGRYTEDVLKIAREEGYHMVLWSRHANDTYEGSTKRKIFERVTSSPRETELIMMHDGPKESLKALPEIIDFYRKKGFKFKTVSEVGPPLFKGTKIASKQSLLTGTFTTYGENVKFNTESDNDTLKFIGILTVFATVGSSVFFIKLSRSSPDNKKIVSFVFIGYDQQRIKKVLGILKKLDIKGAFFLSPGDTKKLESWVREQLGNHKIGFRSGNVNNDITKQLKDWEKNLDILKYVVLPLYYSKNGYSKRIIQEIKKTDFVPVDWEIPPIDNNRDFILDELSGESVLPVDITTDSSVDLLKLIEQLYQEDYSFISLEDYMLENHKPSLI